MILQQCDCLCLLYLQNISKIFHAKWKYFMSSGVVVFNNLDLSLNMLCGRSSVMLVAFIEIKKHGAAKAK